MKMLLAALLMSCGLLFSGMSSIGHAQDGADIEAMTTEQLAEQAGALHPAALYVLAARLLSEGRGQESANWMYAGQLRYRFLLATRGEAGTDDHILFSALSEQVGRPVNEHIAGDPDEWIAAHFARGKYLEGQRVERIPGQHGRRFIEGEVHGRLAMAQLVIVHAGQIVMDQRIGVDRLDGAGGPHGGRAVHSIHLGRRREQQGAHALAPADRGIAHRLDQSGAAVIGHRQQFVECRIDLGLDVRETGLKYILGQNQPHFTPGASNGAQSASNGSVRAGAPSGPATIFSIRACAASRRAWQCFRKASPRS